MKDLGEEPDLGRCHGVVVGEEKLELKDTAYLDMRENFASRTLPSRFGMARQTVVWRLRGAMDLNVKISQVVIVWDGADSGDTAYTSVRHPRAG